MNIPSDRTEIAGKATLGRSLTYLVMAAFVAIAIGGAAMAALIG